jgi:hypothetical protein
VLSTDVLRWLISRYGPDLVIVHGDATGVEESFVTAAKGFGLTIEAHPARWHSLGPAAGPMRTEEMVEAGADLCVALHRSIARSMGTKGCIRKALAAGIPVYLIESDKTIPRRLSADDERLK